MNPTPGKWVFDDGLGEIIADFGDGDFLVATIESNDGDGPLIAAAPELLEACRATLGKFEREGWDVGGAYRLALSKAIARAEGK